MTSDFAGSYEFGPFSLDVGEGVLRREGRLVPLRPKDLELLRALLENSGRLLEKDELLRRVWPDSFVEEANLSYHVFTLRKVLGDDREASRYVETVPRRGYRFVANGIRDITMRPIGAVRRYTSLQQDPVAAGSELGASVVLDGSIQRAGDRIRVTLRLLRVDDGATLWTGHFDERFTDIFAVQDAISDQVTRSLVVRLNAEDNRRLAKRYTDNVAAYELYLKGRFSWNKRTEEGMRNAIEYFRQAVAIAPDYALAYSGLADSYALLSNSASGVAPSEAFPQARRAAEQALALDEALAEAHTSLAFVKEAYDWDWVGAEREYRRALELDPNYASAHHRYGMFLCMMARCDRGLLELEQARRLDPTSMIINADAGLGLYIARRYDDAIDQLRKAVAL